MLRKSLLWLVVILATLVLLIILFYAEEDWRGARDWTACQKELAAKGETLDLRQLAPPGKPEDDLSKVPIFANGYKKNPGRYYIGLITPIPPPRQLSHLDIYFGNEKSVKYPPSSNYLNAQTTDLAAWQKFYRSLPEAHLSEHVGTPAQDVLQALSQFDPQMNEIDTAVSNPNAYWPINYENPYTTNLSGIVAMIPIAKVVQLKAVAHLDNHETDLAEKDYLFSFRLNQSLAKNCFFVNYSIMVGVRTIDDSILWEGIHRHAWSSAQLQDMESAQDSTDMLMLAANTLRIERASTLETMKVIQERDTDAKRAFDEKYGAGFLHIRPAGWWDQDMCHYSLDFQKKIEGIDAVNGMIKSLPWDPQYITALRTQFLGWGGIYIPFSFINLNTTSGFGVKIAQAETYRRLARLACRLEEYRIAHGQYPEKLDDLPNLPAHLNQEVLSEQPLRYQRKGDGYLLYSIGWNQKDDGGVLAPDAKEGDWVWPSP